jgi:hypothetical protein
MGDDEPIDPEALLAMVAEMTVWASPGLAVDDFHPDLGALAILTVAASDGPPARRSPARGRLPPGSSRPVPWPGDHRRRRA